jgi:glucosamine 6-phosphate synthetase-like amidotransferase/phosphosugar isomerase protein
VRIACFHPVELLNLGKPVDPTKDLVVLISWSGTTDSVLKSDSRLAEEGILRLGITGRPQSDLGRRTTYSAGTLNVHSGVEVSVATVKGFEAILMSLNLLAFYLAENSQPVSPSDGFAALINELITQIPKHIRAITRDKKRREQIKEIARQCRHYNKVAIIGTSPVDIEAELKIEELAQIVAGSFDYQTASLRAMMERSGIVEEDRQRTLFVINATTKQSQREAQPLIHYLNTLDVAFIVHTIPGEKSERWRAVKNAVVFDSPQVSEVLQPLVDVLFFFDFSVALAYGRGLSPREIDQPRNLAKSVTTTGAEKRSEVESRFDFINITMEEYTRNRTDRKTWAPSSKKSTSIALQASTAIKAGLSVLTEPLSNHMVMSPDEALVLVSGIEAVDNAVRMAQGAWVELLDMEISTNHRYFNVPLGLMGEARLIQIVSAGSVPALQEPGTIALPEGYSPLQLELAGTVYLIGLAVRIAQRTGKEMGAWEYGLASLPQTVKVILEDLDISNSIRVTLAPFVRAGYDKAHIIGGGQDYASAASIARSLRERGFMAEALYTDSAWHGPLAAVGGPDADHDTLVVILASDPLFQSAAMVDTQVYRARNAPVFLVVPENNKDLRTVLGVKATAVFPVPVLPRSFLPVANAIFGAVLAREMDRLWSDQ